MHQYCEGDETSREAWNKMVMAKAEMGGLGVKVATAFVSKFLDPEAFVPMITGNLQDEIICLEVACAVICIWLTIMNLLQRYCLSLNI